MVITQKQQFKSGSYLFYCSLPFIAIGRKSGQILTLGESELGGHLCICRTHGF